MKLTTRSRYGTRMLLDLAQNGGGGPVRVSEIANRQGISVKYLEKLSRILKKAGLIRSMRGSKGGHLLAKPPADISMGEIVRALEGDLNLVTCWTERTSCPRLKTCATSKLWQEVSKALLERLDSMSLDELLKSSALDGTSGACEPGKPL
ncbi:RrF2 family transcriptional regulator [Fundidesulfovibrio terrae]|uniref:RrF2 family transcriptional regulator n=1 Tax=Fundidesulfovibrio terrae TaxID=2922866 RepID=UPI001FAF640A|nr:Rrf2 family transcriptional regulator [Fundidesulfovibrio terrae]